MHHEQHVREAGAEVRTVRVMVARRLGRVHIDALRAVRLDHRLAGNVGQTWGVRRNDWVS